MNQQLENLIKKAQDLYSEKYLMIAIPGFLSKKYISYCSMIEDLRLSLEYLDYMKRDNDSVIKSSLCYSLIALYGKCFTDASKGGYPKLEPGSIFKNQEDFKRTHEYLMELRHTFIAHRGKTESEIGIAFMILEKGKGNNDVEIKFSQLKQNGFSKQKLLEIDILIHFLIKYLEVKIQKMAQDIYNTMLDQLNVKQLSLMLMNGSNDRTKK